MTNRETPFELAVNDLVTNTHDMDNIVRSILAFSEELDIIDDHDYTKHGLSS